jgi:hypothetical protein
MICMTFLFLVQIFFQPGRMGGLQNECLKYDLYDILLL